MRRATSKSSAAGGVDRKVPLRGRGGFVCLAIAASCIASCQLQADPEGLRLRALKAHEDSRDATGARPDDVQSAWELGRACFDLAEFATNDTQRAALAREGIHSCQHALSLNSTSAPARYYLGMNRGQLARTTTLGALRLVDRMERDFLAARELDPTFDESGPDRNLGLLYLQAPGWPVSVGSQGKARLHLRRAAKLSPLYPENRLNLMEAFAKWGDSSALQTEFEAWVVSRPEAEQRYAGDRWRQDWLQWDQRLDRLRGLLPELSVSEQTRAD